MPQSSIKEIASKNREDITIDDLLMMDNEQLVDLFHQLEAPEFEEMHGEYRAVLLDAGNIVKRSSSDFFLNSLWGRWLAKAFEPVGENYGHGYNSFRASKRRKGKDTVRIMRMKTRIGDSIYDTGKSFHLEYHDYNPFPISTMKDEVRRVNDNLYLGLGILTVTLGKKNIFPFVLIGPLDEWVGPDEGYPEE